MPGIGAQAEAVFFGGLCWLDGLTEGAQMREAQQL